MFNVLLRMANIVIIVGKKYGVQLHGIFNVIGGNSLHDLFMKKCIFNKLQCFTVSFNNLFTSKLTSDVM